MQFARILLFNILFVSSTAILSLLVTPGLFLPYRVAIWLKQVWLWLVLGLARHIMGIRTEIRGRENIPDGPVVFAVKHQSAWDTMALGAAHPHGAFVLKHELVRLPIWGWYLLRLGMIPIDRAKGMVSLMKITRAAGKLIAQGRSVLIFPQGTRTLPGTKHPYLPGVASIYKGTRVPVVPVALNSGLFWPKKLMNKYPGTITMEYLEPIQPGLDRETFMETLETRIETATARLEAEALERFPYLPKPMPAGAETEQNSGSVDTDSPAV